MFHCERLSVLIPCQGDKNWSYGKLVLTVMGILLVCFCLDVYTYSALHEVSTSNNYHKYVCISFHMYIIRFLVYIQCLNILNNLGSLM